jgi:hypothetical protein
MGEGEAGDSGFMELETVLNFSGFKIPDDDIGREPRETFLGTRQIPPISRYLHT